MGNAMCQVFGTADITNGHYIVSCPTFFIDEALEVKDGGDVTVEFAYDATPLQIKTAATDAIIAYAAYRWPTMSLAAVDIIIPEYQRG